MGVPSHLQLKGTKMSLKVYADLMSQPARSVVIFCRAAGVPHEHVGVRITAGDTKTEEYRRMNPLCKVADHWYPKESQAQARVDEYLEWQHLGTRFHCANYFIERWLKPMQTRKMDEAEIA